jgi:hypothetical protein
MSLCPPNPSLTLNFLIKRQSMPRSFSPGGLGTTDILEALAAQAAGAAFMFGFMRHYVSPG